MQLKKEHVPLSIIKHKLIIDVSPAHSKEYIRKAIDYFRKNTEIPGFRKGKAPGYAVIGHIGDKNVKKHAAELLARDAFDEASKGLEKPPVTMPVFEYDGELTPGKEFKISAIYYVEPPDPKTMAKEIQKEDSFDIPSPEQIFPEGPPNIQNFSGNPISLDALRKVPGLNLADKFMPNPIPEITDSGKLERPT